MIAELNGLAVRHFLQYIRKLNYKEVSNHFDSVLIMDKHCKGGRIVIPFRYKDIKHFDCMEVFIDDDVEYKYALSNPNLYDITISFASFCEVCDTGTDLYFGKTFDGDERLCEGALNCLDYFAEVHYKRNGNDQKLFLQLNDFFFEHRTGEECMFEFNYDAHMHPLLEHFKNEVRREISETWNRNIGIHVTIFKKDDETLQTECVYAIDGKFSDYYDRSYGKNGRCYELPEVRECDKPLRTTLVLQLKDCVFVKSLTKKIISAFV